MEKKRSVGVTLFGRIFSVVGISGAIILLIGLVGLIFREKAGFDLYKYYSSEKELIIKLLYILFVYVPWSIIGFGTLKLKPWARILSISLMIIYLLSNILNIMGLFLSVRNIWTSLFWIFLTSFTIYFFSRPKVKRQFTGAES